MSPAAKGASAPANNSLVLEFDFKKETPGTNQFRESGLDDGERGAIGTLYVTKKALATLKGTKRLRVTIEGIG